MPSAKKPQDSSESETSWQQLEEVVKRFEAAWRRGHPPVLDDYLPSGADERWPVLVELVYTDLEWRIKAGEPAHAADYLERYPELACDPVVARDLVHREQELRQPATPTPTPPPKRAVAGPGKLVLEVIDGPHRNTRFEFDRHETFVVGRSRSAHLSLPEDRSLSRHHFLLEFNPPHAYLRDLGSRNGTLVNGAPVKEAFLEDGDIVRGGRTRLRFSVQPAAASTAAPDLTGVACGKAVAATGRDSTDFMGPPSSYLCERCRRKARKQPQTVPGYEIVRPLGEGRLGAVYLARHIGSGDPVALKLIVPESAAGHRAVQLFLSEVNVLRQLDHPRIVRFREAGLANGQFFVAMEYVPTVDAAALLARRSLRTRMKTACALVCQVLEALAYGHGKGFVHRGVKPANVLVLREGKKLRVKVADFGLAGSVENAGLGGLKRSGPASDALGFLAPEQLLDARSAGAPADLYGAAATLYFFLAGRPPHDFSSQRDPYAIILEEDITPLNECVANVPARLAAVVHRALARDPEQRFPSAAAMLKALLPFARAGESKKRKKRE
jgi:eukaryotic-like serine/threonine-protein kinase